MYQSQEDLTRAIASITEKLTAMEEQLPIRLADVNLSEQVNQMEEDLPLPKIRLSVKTLTPPQPPVETRNPFVIPKKPKKKDICKKIPKVSKEFLSYYDRDRLSTSRHRDGTNIYDLSMAELQAVVKSMSNTKLDGFTPRELRDYIIENNSAYYYGVVTSRVILQDWKEQYYLNSPEYRAYHQQANPWLYK